MLHSPVINLSLAGLLVDGELVQVVVEVRLAGAQVAAEQGRVGREDCRDVDVTRADGDEPDARLPLVEVRDDLRLGQCVVLRMSFGRDLELADEMSDHVAEDDRVVRLDVQVGDPDRGLLEELLSELVQLPSAGADVEEYDLRIAVDEPAAAVDLVAERAQRVDGPGQRRVVCELALLDLLPRALLLVRAQQTILVAELLCRHVSLRPDHRVDAADLVRRLPCHLEREPVLYVCGLTPVEELQQIGARLHSRIASTHI